MYFEEFESTIGQVFTDKQLLRLAFTHRSYLNEHREEKLQHNERLEFLGDAVLELIVTNYLYAKFPKHDEGDLTAYRSALVNTQSLSETARELRMGDYLLLSRGEARDIGRARQFILANTFEAVVGALYLDAGYDAAKTFVERVLIPKLTAIIEEGAHIDGKSRLQEVAQDKLSVTPRYETIGETGPDHDKRFEVAVFLGTDQIASGSGKSKQDAEQAAARFALKKKGWL